MTASLTLNIDRTLKEQTADILAEMGLSFNDAFNLMLHQVRIQRALPFSVAAYGHTPTAETLATIERIENGTAEMAGPFETFAAYKAWLDEDDDDEI